MKKNIANKSAKALALGLAVALGSSTAISGVVGGSSVVRASVPENAVDTNEPDASTYKYIEVADAATSGKVFTFEITAADTTNNDDTTNSGTVKLISYGNSKGASAATGEQDKPFIGTFASTNGTGSAPAVNVKNSGGTRKYNFDIVGIGDGTSPIATEGTIIASADATNIFTKNLKSIEAKALNGIEIQGAVDLSKATNKITIASDALVGVNFSTSLKLKQDVDLSNVDNTTSTFKVLDLSVNSFTNLGTGKFVGANIGELKLNPSQAALAKDTFKGANITKLDLSSLTNSPQVGAFDEAKLGTVTVKETIDLSGSATGKGATIETLTSAADTIKASGLAHTTITKAVTADSATTVTNAFKDVTFKGATISLKGATATSGDLFKGAKFELGGEDNTTKNTIELDKVTSIKTNTFKDLDLTNVDFPATSLKAVTSIETDAFRNATLEGKTLKLDGVTGEDAVKTGAFDTAKGNFAIDLSGATIQKDTINAKAFSNTTGNIVISVKEANTADITDQFKEVKNVTVGDATQATATAIVEEANKIKITFSKPVKAENVQNFAEVLTLTKTGSKTNLISETTKVPEGLVTEFVIDLKEAITSDDVLTLNYKAPVSGDKKIVDNLGKQISAEITVKNTVGKTAPKALSYYSTGTDSDKFLYIEFDQPLAKKGTLTNTFKVAGDTVSAADILSENDHVVKLTLTTGITDDTKIALTYTPDEKGGNYLHLEGYETQKVGEMSYTEAPKSNSEKSDNATAPVFKSAKVDEKGQKVILTFDEPVLLGGTANQVFTVTSGINQGNDVNNAITDAKAKGKTVELTLTTPVHKGDFVSVVYTSDTSTNNVTDLFKNKVTTLNIESVDTNGVTGERDTTAPVIKGTPFAYNSSSKGIIEVTFDKGISVNGNSSNEINRLFKVSKPGEKDRVNLTVEKVEAIEKDDKIDGTETLKITLKETVSNGDLLELSYTNNNENPSGTNISNTSKQAFVKSISLKDVAIKQNLKKDEIIEIKDGLQFKVLPNSKDNDISVNADGSVNVAFVGKVAKPQGMEARAVANVTGENVEVKNGTFSIVGNNIVVSQIGGGTAIEMGEGVTLTTTELENIGALATTVKADALKDVTVTGNANLVLKNVTNVEDGGLAISKESEVKTVYLPKETDVDVTKVFGSDSSVTGIVVETSAKVTGTEGSKINVTKKDKAKVTSAEITDSSKDTITVKFDKAINADSVKTEDVKVNVNNSSSAVKQATVSDKTVTIKLSSPVKAKDGVNLTLNAEDSDFFTVDLSSYSVKNSVTDNSSSNGGGSGSGGSSNGGSGSSSSGNGGSGSAVINPENTTSENTTGNVTEGSTEATTKDLSFATVKLPTVGEALSFTDVPTTHWANSSISKLSAMGVINGMPNGSFNASGNSKRADVAIMFTRLLGLEGASSSTFADVPYNAYYANSVGLAKDYGIINGTSNGNFNPNGNITRQDTMVMIDRVLRSLDIPVNTDTTVLAQFADTSKISGYALESVASLVNSGIINGNGGKINPTAPITRAEIATIMDRLYTIIDDASKKAATETTTEEKSSETTSEIKSSESSTATTTESSTETTTEKK